MITLTTAAATALGNPTVNLVQLLLLEFPSGDVALNSSNFDLEWDGVTYKGAYGMGGVGEIEDGPGEVKGIEFTLNGGSADIIALALDDAKEWQGTPVTIRTAILDDSYTVVDAPTVWIGKGDTMAISDDDDATTVTATAESSAVDFLRGDALVYNHADQQTLYPSDLGFNLVISQAEGTVVWPSASWYYK